jgi:autotransporter-associated beta strand protein
MRKAFALAIASGTAGLGFYINNSAQAAIIQATTGTSSWATSSNWNPTTVPNTTGANATFNGAATGSNPAQTGNRVVSLDGTKTVGSILFNNDLSTFTNTVQTGTGGPLVFDEVGAGPAVITTQGSGTGNNTISVAMTLTDTLRADVNNITASSGAGSLNLTGTMSGAGGFTKNGDGLVTFGTGTKTYAGATTLNGGRLRTSAAARPSATSSLTINTGAQLTLITDAATYGFGAGPLNLNGAGPTSGPYAIFPGAIRNDTGLTVTLSNDTVLQSSTTLHVQATAGTGGNATPTGAITFSGIVSGPGKLTLTGAGSNVDQGSIILTNGNSYQGGTLVAGGIVAASGANATFGTGDVEANNATSPNSIARVSILSGVLNAIADTASLRLAGGNAGFAVLGTGVNETVSYLYLNGQLQNPGTYGSTASPATNQLNNYFQGDGIVTVLLPEPATLGLLALAAPVILRRRRRD